MHSLTRSVTHLLFGLIGQVKRISILYTLSCRRQKLAELIIWAKRKRLSGPLVAYQKETEVLDAVLAKASLRHRLLVETAEFMRVATSQMTTRRGIRKTQRKRR